MKTKRRSYGGRDPSTRLGELLHAREQRTQDLAEWLCRKGVRVSWDTVRCWRCGVRRPLAAVRALVAEFVGFRGDPDSLFDPIEKEGG